MNFNQRLLIQTVIASILIILGVVVKNSFEQLGLKNHSVGSPLGMLLFSVGWIYMAYVLSQGRRNKLMVVSPSLAILLTVMAMKMSSKVNMLLPLVFAGAWVVLGYSLSRNGTYNERMLGLLASACVIGSMMYSLPQQRTLCVVDGPGMPLFVFAWGIVSYLNSV